MKLSCRRQTKEEKEAARKEAERVRAEEERGKALLALDGAVKTKPGGGLVHSGLAGFEFAEGGGKALPAAPLSVPRKPAASMGSGRFYA